MYGHWKSIEYLKQGKESRLTSDLHPIVKRMEYDIKYQSRQPVSAYQALAVTPNLRLN